MKTKTKCSKQKLKTKTQPNIKQNLKQKLRKIGLQTILFKVYNDVAPNPPPKTGKPSKAQMPMIKQTALNLRQQKCSL